ncbi:aldehyde dehydrogenase (NADP(+)) [Pragia fontium]|uniref:aldehyde dehydrogenase (NADP(+)) n=1 Tax=Pragia fontium TaxID=82985 RepID=UPI00064A6ECD|nr:aldehyde dehydrogenase (NADP(+)) [Pragia fontium]AKJ43382.1 ketoglutarate semialdehyde dehydrogenase [Pragia fontium]
MAYQSEITHSGKQFIGGERVAEGERTLVSLRAVDGQPTGYRFYQATINDAELAVKAAEAAHLAYSQISSDKRAAFLEQIATEIDALGDEFIHLVMEETALPEARVLGERARTSGQMRLFAQLLRRGDYHAARIDTALPDRKPLSRPDLRQCKIAVGPVAVFGASNFPLAFSTAGGDTASALAAGCPVVVKAHGSHMGTAEFIAQAIEKAAKKQHMPVGVFNMIYGSKIGADLVQHPAIQAVGFTGSLLGGRALFDLATRRPQPIPVFAEMSSINPVIVMPQALVVRGDKIAQELVSSFTSSVGQLCTKPGVIIGIRSTAFSQFIAQLVHHVEQCSAQTMLNYGTLKSYQEGIQALESHPEIKRIGGQMKSQTQADAQLFQADISLLINQDPLFQEEVFGPVSLVVEARDESELYRALQGLQGQLTVTLIGEKTEIAQADALSQLVMRKAGRLLINGYPTGVEVCDSMVHGGPYPATTDARGTSVGTLAIERFLRPVCLQNYPQELLPETLKDSNPLKLLRLVNGVYTRDPL